MVGAARRDAHHLAAQCLGERGVLALGVAYHYVVVGRERKHSYELLGREALARARHAQHERVGVQEPRLVAQDEVARYGVLAEVHAALLHDLLHAERHEHGEALGGERAHRLDATHAYGQRG